MTGIDLPLTIICRLSPQPSRGGAVWARSYVATIKWRMCLFSAWIFNHSIYLSYRCLFAYSTYLLFIPNLIYWYNIIIQWCKFVRLTDNKMEPSSLQTAKSTGAAAAEAGTVQ